MHAHPGHGATDGGSLVHWLCEPVHVGSLLLGLVVVLAALAMVKRRVR